MTEISSVPATSPSSLPGALVQGVDGAASEAALIARAQQYESDALSEIYETFYPRVQHYFSIQLGDTHLAEDMASDVLLQVLESIERYRIQGSPFAAWVFRIARNRLIDHQRRKARRPQVGLEEDLPSRNDGPQALAERSMEHASVRAALNHLTEEQRQVIVLKFIEDMDNASVASILGRSLGAVKSLQHRALGTMRKVLEREEIR